MIKVIKDYLDLVGEEPKDTFSTEDQAEYILGCCETWGMLPPENKEKSFKILPNGEMLYNVNEWDEE